MRRLLMYMCIIWLSTLAAAKSVAVSSSSQKSHRAELAVDGDLKTYWQSVHSEDWLMLDLGKNRPLASICQIFKELSVWKFKVEGSVDGRQWFLLVDHSKGIAGDVFSESVRGTYRYVRLSVLGCTGSFCPSSLEFRVEEVGRRNIALGQKTVQVIQPEKHAPADALDDNLSTYWVAVDGTYPQDMIVDLGAPISLTGVQQIFKDHDTWKFRVEGSNDRLQWDVLADRSEGVTGFDFSASLSGTYRYVRLSVLGSAKGYWANSCEFRLFGTRSEGIHQPEALAFKALCTTSSFHDNAHVQAKAFDDDASTFWYAGSDSYPQWLCADLGMPCEVWQVRQTFAEPDVWSFLIEGSNDNRSWTLLADRSEGLSGTECTADVRGTYRYIRLTVLGAKNRSRASSRSLEIEGFGSPRNTAWWEATSGMTRYYPKYYGQTLRSITQRLDTLQAQGYRSIELSAIYEGDPTVWAGLGATNNYAIDPSIGTMADFEELIREVHARDMRITFFGNVGYCWYKAPFFEKACDDHRNGVDSKEKKWFHFSDRKIDDKWFWSERAQAWYYSFWGNSDGAEGRIPSYCFHGREWQEECRRYLDFWADKGVDGILLDAPEAYDGITDDIIHRSIIQVLNRRGILTNAEGSWDVNRWIGNFGFRLIQGFDIYGWGGGKKSEALNALKEQNPSRLNDLMKNHRDQAVSLGAVTVTPPMWEIPATNEERLFELAFLVSAGTLAINHYGDHHRDYIAQFILAGWPQKDRERFYNLIRLQNSYSALAPLGQRSWIPSCDDSRYAVFKRTAKDGRVAALVIINFQNAPATISVNLKNTGIRLGCEPINLLYKEEDVPVLCEDYRVSLPARGYLILGVQSE